MEFENIVSTEEIANQTAELMDSTCNHGCGFKTSLISGVVGVVVGVVGKFAFDKIMKKRAEKKAVVEEDVQAEDSLCIRLCVKDQFACF